MISLKSVFLLPYQEIKNLLLLTFVQSDNIQNVKAKLLINRKDKIVSSDLTFILKIFGPLWMFTNKEEWIQ